MVTTHPIRWRGEFKNSPGTFDEGQTLCTNITGQYYIVNARPVEAMFREIDYSKIDSSHLENKSYLKKDTLEWQCRICEKWSPGKAFECLHCHTKLDINT